jgi:acyl CoA:acetate/3-ketoacid CoA transferase beta subunit
VEQVDVVSGVGPQRAKAAGTGASRYNDIHRIVSDLAVLDLHGPGDTLRLLSVHPGVTLDQVREATGCDVHVDGDGAIPESRLPTAEELVLINEVLDPQGLRFKEVPDA